MRRMVLALGLAISCGFVTASAAEPGWVPVIIARGDYRETIKSTPIERRPYRPLHFYGNTIRRQYYHGTALPLPRNFTSNLQGRRG